MVMEGHDVRLGGQHGIGESEEPRINGTEKSDGCKLTSPQGHGQNSRREMDVTIEDTTPRLIVKYLILSIGVGIYTSPGPVYENLPIAWASLLLWLLSGLIVAAGGATYGGAALAGREYTTELGFLKANIGPTAAFHRAFISCIVDPAALSIVALSLSEHFLSLILSSKALAISTWAIVTSVIFFIFAAMLLSQFQTLGNRKLQLIYFMLKILLIVGVVGGGFSTLVLSEADIVGKVNSFESANNASGRIKISQALNLVLWCHNGWSGIRRISKVGIRSAGKMYTVVTVSTAMVSILFTAVAASYFVAVNPENFRELTLIENYTKSIIGNVGNIYTILLLFIISFGAAVTIISENVAIAREASNIGLFHPIVSKRCAPIRLEPTPLLLNLIVSVTYVLVFKRDYDTLVAFFILTSYMANSLTAWALLVTQRELNWSSRILPSASPALFISATICILLMGATENTAATIGAIGAHLLTYIAWSGIFRGKYLNRISKPGGEAGQDDDTHGDTGRISIPGACGYSHLI